MIKKATQLYCLLLTAIITTAAFLEVDSVEKALFPTLLLPLNLYFLKSLLDFSDYYRTNTNQPIYPDLAPYQVALRNQAVPRKQKPLTDDALEPEILNPSQVRDLDRRMFLKLIGSAGVAAFVMSLFTDKAHAAFFGSVPGPGVVAIKDSLGNKIDPAEKQPTDGYKISQLDDTSSATYSYFGFVNKNGNWYIQRETTSGAGAGTYLYVRGTTDFAAEWATRLTRSDYGTFDTIF